MYIYKDLPERCESQVAPGEGRTGPERWAKEEPKIKGGREKRERGGL